MKKRLAITAAAILVLSLVAYGTLAYLTAEETAHNVITAGTVSIQLKDQTRGENGALVDFPQPDGMKVMPGVVADKLVSVENTGGNDCWVRIKVDKDITPANGVTQALDVENDVILNLAQFAGDWTAQEGWYYYNKALKPGETTPYLFTQVEFKGEMGNEYQGSVLKLNVQAQAVQADNNSPDNGVLGVTGWPAAND